MFATFRWTCPMSTRGSIATRPWCQQGSPPRSDLRLGDPPTGERPEQQDNPRDADDVGLQAEREHCGHRRCVPGRAAGEPPEENERPGEKEESAEQPRVDAELGVG